MSHVLYINISDCKLLQSYVLMHKMECIDSSMSETFIKVKRNADLYANTEITDQFLFGMGDQALPSKE